MTATDSRRCGPSTAYARAGIDPRPHPRTAPPSPPSASELDAVRDRLLRALSEPTPPGPPLGRFNAVLTRVLNALTADVSASRSYLAESPTIDDGVTARHAALRAQLVTRLVDVFDARGATCRFACEAVAAAITTMTAETLAGGDADALRALRRPLILFAERSLG